LKPDNGTVQQCDSFSVFPREYFCPFDDLTGVMNKTEKTCAIHWYAKSWMSKKDIIRNRITRILHRYLGVDFFRSLQELGSSDYGMTMAFLTMSMCEIFHSFNLRSQRKSIFTLKSRNKVLWAAMIGSLLLTTALLEIPFLAGAFGFVPVGLREYTVAVALGFLVVPLVETVKFFQRRAMK
jgi:magnesium-transporting ATPase (P-type)